MKAAIGILRTSVPDVPFPSKVCSHYLQTLIVHPLLSEVVFDHKGYNQIGWILWG